MHEIGLERLFAFSEYSFSFGIVGNLSLLCRLFQCLKFYENFSGNLSALG